MFSAITYINRTLLLSPQIYSSFPWEWKFFFQITFVFCYFFFCGRCALEYTFSYNFKKKKVNIIYRLSTFIYQNDWPVFVATGILFCSQNDIRQRWQQKGVQWPDNRLLVRKPAFWPLSKFGCSPGTIYMGFVQKLVLNINTIWKELNLNPFTNTV